MMKLSFSQPDIWHMRSALNLARTGLGRVWPNPSVGCVIVKDGHVVGRARTADGGRPHAETIALEMARKMAGDCAKGATAYVTLEPCAHQGQTPPCVQALIAAGVARVVIAVEDTDDRVAGRGVAQLRQAGIKVQVGLLADEARKMNAGYFLKNIGSRPFVTLKTATTLDSKIATITGDSQWITGREARRYVHLMRAQNDAICVGVETVLVDNPSLTARLRGSLHGLVRIVFDTNLRLKGTEKIFEEIENFPVWVVTSVASDDARAKNLTGKGAVILNVPKTLDGITDLGAALGLFCGRGITRLLVEGGAKMMNSFLMEGFYDRLYWFRSGSVIGSDGLDAVHSFGVQYLDEQIKLSPFKSMLLGQDRLDIYEKEA